jgi:hypothetical protein
MKKAVSFFIALFLFIANTAMATTYDFSFSDGTYFYGSGVLTASPIENANGSFTVQSGTCTVFSSEASNAAYMGAYNLYVNPSKPDYQASISPLGDFIYNNQIYTAPTQPFLDIDGLLFTNRRGDELNIWENGAGDPYSAYIGLPGYNYPVTGDAHFGASPVPEPPTMMMFGVSMFILAVYGKRRMCKNEA